MFGINRFFRRPPPPPSPFYFWFTQCNTRDRSFFWPFPRQECWHHGQRWGHLGETLGAPNVGFPRWALRYLHGFHRAEQNKTDMIWNDCAVRTSRNSLTGLGQQEVYRPKCCCLFAIAQLTVYRLSANVMAVWITVEELASTVVTRGFAGIDISGTEKKGS